MKAPTFGLVVQEKKLGLIAWRADGHELDQQWLTLDNMEIDRLIIFKPALLAPLITSFIHRFSHADDSPCIITLDGPGISENVHQEIPEMVDIGYAWNFYPLGKRWYGSGIPFWLRAQYQLLALRLPVKLIGVTSLRAVYTSLYQENNSSTDMQHMLALLRESMDQNSSYSKALYTPATL